MKDESAAGIFQVYVYVIIYAYLPDLKYVTEKNLIDYIFSSQQPCSGDRLTDNMNL